MKIQKKTYLLHIMFISTSRQKRQHNKKIVTPDRQF